DLGGWTRVFGAGSSASVVVINPDSGVGQQQYEHWVDVRARARVAGQKAIGYVYTNGGARPPAAVAAEVQQYLAWYDVDGIFLDGTPGDCSGGATYVSTLATQIRNARANAFVAASP